jgi:hypothetical protein
MHQNLDPRNVLIKMFVFPDNLKLGLNFDQVIQSLTESSVNQAKTNIVMTPLNIFL